MKKYLFCCGWRNSWRIALVLFIAQMAEFGGGRAAEPSVIYRTGFEAEEGFAAGVKLEEQQGWWGGGEELYQGENGITNEVFAAYGQQAYLGGSLQALGVQYYYVWHPIGLDPIPAETRLIRFSVLMGITASTNAAEDNFYWNLYNSDGDLLFSLDFDNYYKDVSYWLEDATEAVQTGVSIENGVIYLLTVEMDFANNLWHASLEDSLLATNQPITTAGTVLNLRDIEAGWNVYTLGSPGDNLMIFDEYEILSIPFPDPVAFTRMNKASARDNFEAQVTGGDPGQNYVVEFTADFLTWTPVSTNTASPGGAFDFIDRSTSGINQRFYRARLLP